MALLGEGGGEQEVSKQSWGGLGVPSSFIAVRRSRETGYLRGSAQPHLETGERCGLGEEGQGGNGKSSHWARQDLGDGVSSCRCYPSQVRARQGMDALGEVGYISLCWHFSFLQ